MMKQRKTALLKSGLALLLCVSMLIGSTFAWFTDSVTSSSNIIKAGKLDIEMYWTDDLNSGVWHNVEEDGKNTIFSYENWEPGYTDVKYIKLVNKGNLALNYKLTLTPQNGVGKLAEVINVYFADEAVEMNGREDLDKLGAIGLLNNVLSGGTTADGTLLATDQYSPLHPSGETVVTLAMNMLTTAGNDYQGKDAGDFTITALATQAPFEQDAFGFDYDGSAEYPQLIVGGSVTATFTPDNGKVPAGGITLQGNGISAYAPAGVALKNGVDKLTLSVTPLKNTTSDITVVNDEVLIPVDVHVEGVAEDNTTPIIVDLGEVLPKYLNMGNYHLFHVEDGANSVMTLVDNRDALTAHNTFTYDPLTGAVSVAMASFSEVALVAETAAGWKGNFNYDWYDASKDVYEIANADQLAGFGAIVGGMNGKTRGDFAGKTVKLLSNINLGDAEGANPEVIFYPIGYYYTEDKNADGTTGDYYSTVYSFEGTFDGNGHTVANFYHNTWEIKGDYEGNYYSDAMGLFGYVVNGTVKNLTVDNFSSDGEFTPTGVVAAYAVNSTFENIAITNCEPRVYNTGNGGIVGIGGNSDDPDTYKLTFNNITIDNTNKITALWGSWDVACGGLVGMFRGAGHVYMTNCHVAAQMDVYNDVCGNYQYYWYRYSGMMVGTNKNMVTDKDGYTVPETSKFHAEGCTVHFGDWNDYYYCELVANTLASYTHDHQFSRLEQITSLDEIKSGNTWTKTGNFLLVSNDTKTCYHIVKDSDGTLKQHLHTDAGEETVNGKTVLKEDKQIVYLPFNQLFTGYGWGVKHIPVYNGEDYAFEGITILDREVADSVEKFETKFTGDFLYRVGNQNTLPIGALFQHKDGTSEIKDAGVWVTVEKLNDEMNVSGTFTADTKDWPKGTLKFEGTGIAKITIQDYNFCTPTVLYVEVVDATNHTSSSISSLGSGNVALLCNTKLNNNGALALQNASLYGNGFIIDVSAGRTTGESITANYLLYMNNATIDNVQVIGAVYTNFDVIASNQWNNPVILSVGDSTIANSYISNCASPVRLRSGHLNIINSTLKGGFFANLDIRGGNVVLDNVTTINQANLNDKSSDGKEIVGLGVVFYYEGPSSDTTVTIKNKFTQHNYLKNEDTGNSYANMLIKEIFGSDVYSEFIYTDANGVKWANTGILSLSEEVEADNIKVEKQTNKDEYKGKTVSYSNSLLLGGSAKGYLYSTNPKVLCNSYEYVPSSQYEIVPKVSFDHKVNEHIKQEGSETSCTSDSNTNVETITFADGDSFEWNVNILKSANKAIEYTVWMDGVKQADTIVFDESGRHTITFKYTDANNYRKNEKGEIVKYTAEYEASMEVVVSEMAAAAKNAEITFPLLESYGTTKVTVDGKTYIMPNLTGTNIPKYSDDLTFDASTRKYGSLKADGKTSVDIYYPIIKTAFSGNYMVFPVFGNKNGTLVQIQDYADGGTGAALTPYNASTQALPEGLSVSRGYTVQWSTDKDVVGSGSMSYGNWTNGLLAFKYQSSSDNIACNVMSKYLSYYPNINLRTNDRNEQVMVAEYKYVDAKGDTYYYCVGYHIEERNNGYAFGETVPESSGGTCLAEGTQITLADGSKSAIEDLRKGDLVMSYDHLTGQITSQEVIIVVRTQSDFYKNTFVFDDGSELITINEHGIYDFDLRKYVNIDHKNYVEYLDHRFVSIDTNGVVGVKKLVDVISEWSTGFKYDIVTDQTLNYVAENTLSVTHVLVDVINSFDFDENLLYDKGKMQKDIEKYGLYTYDEWAEYCDISVFEEYNIPVMKVGISKGLYTKEYIIGLINQFVLDESVQIVD